MRESIGGTWLLGFVVLFIVLFSGYLAVSINYTKAFKSKNQIINIIEENEGFTKSGINTTDRTEDKIIEYLRSVGYATVAIDKNKCENPDNYINGGYCVDRICTSQGSYYKVTTFIKIELPIVWQSFTIPITGETKLIYYNKSDLKCNKDRYQ